MRAEQLSLGLTFVRGHVQTGRSEKSHSTSLRNSGSRHDDKDRLSTSQTAACKQGLCATKQNSRARKLGSFFQPGHFSNRVVFPKSKGHVSNRLAAFQYGKGEA